MDDECFTQAGFTESDWLTAYDVDMMLNIVGGGTIFDFYPFRFLRRFFGANRRKGISRKLRLFSCACCRRLESLLDKKSREAIEITERWADDPADERQLLFARNLAQAAQVRFTSELQKGAMGADARWHAAEAVIAACCEGDFLNGPARAVSQHSSSAIGYNADRVYNSSAWQVAWSAARREQARFLLDAFGNPFRPNPLAASWLTSVIKLADGVYSGQPCSFALHDALLESGHPELAEHFRDPKEWHPKGCWALDLILGKRVSVK